MKLLKIDKKPAFYYHRYGRICFETFSIHHISLKISDCFDCDKIVVKLFNNPAQYQEYRAGTYEATMPINGHPAWISKSDHAIWNIGNKWIIGSNSSFGSSFGGIFAQNDTECPNEVSIWQIHDGNDWIDVPSSDVAIECFQLIGTLIT